MFRRRTAMLLGAAIVLVCSVAAVAVATPGAAAVPAANYRAAVMADSPLAYWRFATTASETGVHNGTLRGSPAPLLNQPGPFGGNRSIRFDGVLRDNTTTGGFLANSLARLPASTWNNGFALEAWAKTTTNGPEQHVMTWSNANGDAGPGVLFDDDDDRWKFRDGNVSLSMNHGTTINAWHYIVATVGKFGNGKLYVDGQEVRSWNSGVDPIAEAGGLFTVGADYDAGTIVDTPFNGWIAETAVYNKPLGPARIKAHFAARFGNTTTTTGGASSTTTRSSTTTSSSSTTSTTVPSGCTGTPVNQPSDISQPNTTYCLSGVHNWTLHPKSGDTIKGGILDGLHVNPWAIVADPCTTNVTLVGIEVRNYTAGGGSDARGAITVQNPCSSGWRLNNLQVHDNGIAGAGGAGVELVDGWVVTGGRVYNNRQEGLTNGPGDNFTIDGVEIDHNNFANNAYVDQSVSCGHEAGGVKWVAQNVTVKNSNVHHNACLGLWTDINSFGVVIDNNWVHDNWNSGILHEISGSATISNNVVEWNGFKTFGDGSADDPFECGATWGGGIQISDSGRTPNGDGNIDIYGNTVRGNCNGIVGVDNGNVPWELAHVHSHDNTVSGSTNPLARNVSGNYDDDGVMVDLTFANNTYSGINFCGNGC